MPPFAGFINLSRREFNSTTAPNEFRNQWTNPGDVFTVLLVVGGDVIARALAQLAGSRLPFLPFSFGWVAYSVSTVVAAVGDDKLMPVSDFPCKVINGSTGYARDNSSWIIGRILRDFDFWMSCGNSRSEGGAKIRKRLEQVLDDKWELLRNKDKTSDIPRPTRAGLCVSVYKMTNATKKPQHVGPLDWIGVATAIVQLCIAAAPWVRSGDWSVFLVTAIGTLLALLTALLPQWAKEKWACRERADKTVILTKGNGSQHAIVIISNGHGFDLEDLASESLDQANLPSASTRVCTSVLAVLWIMLLVAAAGIKENTWFLLGVGSLGMIENLYQAGKRRLPESFGLTLEFVDVIAQPSVMDTLHEVEEKYRKVGRSMLDTFFPGKLHPQEVQRWEEYENR